MAFTDDEQAQIRMYLGWSARYMQTDDALRRAYDSVGTLASDAALIQAGLTEVARIDAAIEAAERRIKAEAVGPIKLNGGEIEQLRDRGRQAVGRMARTLGVEVRGDAFSGALPTERATTWGVTGGSGYQLQG